MKSKIILLFGLVLGLFTSFTGLAQTNWQLIWNEEFDYTGLPDADKWGYDVGCATNNNEKQAYTKDRLENARVEEGNLIIEARKEVYGTCGYTSARLVSKGKGDWLYGKMEVRAQIPTGRGTWPAIWMLPSDNTYGGWPKSGEIDIMENVGFQPNRIYGTIHTDAFNHVKKTEKSGYVDIVQPFSKFCVYTTEWSQDSIRFFVDDVKFYTFKKEANFDFTKWPFDKRFHMILNLAIGGDWGGANGIDDAIFPQKFYVDYVRVYQTKQASPYTVAITQTKGGTGTISPSKSIYDENEEVSISATAEAGYEFQGWSSDFFKSSPNFNFTVNRNITFKPLFSKVGEMLKNSNFNNGFSNWLNQYYDGAQATFTIIENGVEINISTLGINPWNVQLIQTDLALYNGKTYELSFELEADRNMTIKGGVGMNAEPYTNYSQINLTATTTKKAIKQTFKMTKDDLVARYAFDLGTSLGKVKITNLSLVEVITAGLEEDFESKSNDVYLNQLNELLFINKSEIETLRIYNYQGRLLYDGQVVNKLRINQNAIVLVNYKDGRSVSTKVMPEVY